MNDAFRWPLLAVFITMLCASISMAAPDESPIDLLFIGAYDGQNGSPIPLPQEGRPALVDLKLRVKKTGRFLTPNDLVIDHEKLFHLYGFDLGLTNYVHEHPIALQRDQTVWRVKILFKQAGIYHLWSDVTLPAQNVGTSVRALTAVQNPRLMRLPFFYQGLWNSGWAFVAPPYPPALRRSKLTADPAAPNNINVKSTTLLKVGGTSKPNQQPKSLEPRLVGNDHISGIALLSDQEISAGKPVMLGLRFFRTDGTKPDIKPYLGALAHVVITNILGDHIMHVHPMEHNGTLMLHTNFPVAGDYRFFVQFIDGQALRTVEVAVRAK